MRKPDYLLAIHVPVYVDGVRRLAATDWVRSLSLLRRSLGDRIRRLTWLAPAAPLEADTPDQSLEEIDDAALGIECRPSMDYRCRARSYWLRERARWQRDVTEALDPDGIAHVGMNDLYRPINFDALRVALGGGACTVFVRDTDELLKTAQLRAAADRTPTVRDRLYDAAYDACIRHAVRRADLSLLKGRDLFDRYRDVSRNPRLFQDVSYTRDEIVAEETRLSRVARMLEGGPLRLTYCGRLEARKGVDRSIRVVARAVALGVDCRFHVIGDGPERAALERLATAEGVAERVRFIGRRPYDAALFRELADQDALLFTPVAEDTPRMIFDAFACGLPVIGADIAYVRERRDVDRAVEVIPFDDVKAGAHLLSALDRDRSRLASLSELAVEAARANAAESWYARRADWTFEAFDRSRAVRQS